MAIYLNYEYVTRLQTRYQHYQMKNVLIVLCEEKYQSS